MRLLNRDFKIPADGWIQVCPRGEFYHEDAKITQVFDEVSIEAMKNRFDEDAKDPNSVGALLDFDHFSLDSSTASEAAGWITAMEVRPEGLFAQVRWSDVGEAAVKGGRYRNVSPVFARDDMVEISDGKFRPMRLDSCAITNSPRLLRMKPLSNSNRNQSETTTDKKVNYKATLTSLLNLSETATDEEISSAIAAANTKRTEAAAANAATAASATTAKAEAANRKAEITVLQNRVAALEAENGGLLTEQIDRDLEAFSDVIENRDEMKKLLVTNRTMALSLLKQIKKAPTPSDPNAGKQPIHNRAKAGTPPPVTSADGKTPQSAQKTEKDKWIGNRARALKGQNPTRPYAKCHQQAEVEAASEKFS